MDRLKQHLRVPLWQHSCACALKPVEAAVVYFKRCQPCITRSSLMLQDQGLTSTDLPKAIVFHEVLGAAMAIGFWSVSVLRGVGHDH